MRMTMIELHRRALADATDRIDRIGPADAGLATTCAGWDLAALLAHMIGQNHGFADAVDAGRAGIGAEAFAPRPAGADPAGAWRDSAARLAASLAAAPSDVEVRLPEIGADLWFPLETVTGFHLVDTVVHTWDVASALGRRYRPDDDLVDASLALALQVPDGPARSGPGAAFAPSVPPADPADPWARTLAALGRIHR